MVGCREKYEWRMELCACIVGVHRALGGLHWMNVSMDPIAFIMKTEALQP